MITISNISMNALCLVWFIASNLLAEYKPPTPEINPPPGRIAIIANGNSPDPDDLGATAVSIALLRATRLESRLVHYSNSCDLVLKGPRISERAVIERHALMQSSCDVTARRWRGFDDFTFHDAKWQMDETIHDLSKAINASTVDDPLKSKWDCSDAGMVLYWITGATEGSLKQGTVTDVKEILLQYINVN